MTRGVPRAGSRAPASAPKPEDAAIADHVSYNPETGEFTWIAARSSRVLAGQQAGSVWRRKGDARYVIRFNHRGYQGNRVAWLIMTGSWPSGQVDHQDGDSLNNRWTNLRLATHSQNTANAKRRRDNTTGFKGVTRRACGRFSARIQVCGRRVELGYFETAEAAHAAYSEAAAHLHGEFGRAS